MKRGDFVWLIIFLGLSSLLLVPATRDFIINAGVSHAYLTGFVKFAVLATMGELLALRIVKGGWGMPAGLVYKTLVWGFLGMAVVLYFEIFAAGVAEAIDDHFLYTGSSAFSTVIKAFYVSVAINLSFGPVMMIFHRFTDTYIDLSCEGRIKGGDRLTAVIHHIDWQGFYKFVIFKTIPCFWLPAHTITFLIPGQFRILYAAYLSLALGTILAYAKKRGANSPMKL